jgi:hypothetical protein
MIKGVMGGSGINIQGGHTSFPYIPMNNNNPIQGMLRVNGQDMQVFDGANWVTVGASYATVDLNGETQAILQWAREQRDKQEQREHRIKNNPALMKAYEAIQRAEENFDILDKIVGDDI